ncbi:hypothetical protein WJX77_002231 [Trebouxia sp. C0004]
MLAVLNSNTDSLGLSLLWTESEACVTSAVKFTDQPQALQSFSAAVSAVYQLSDFIEHHILLRSLFSSQQGPETLSQVEVEFSQAVSDDIQHNYLPAIAYQGLWATRFDMLLIPTA